MTRIGRSLILIVTVLILITAAAIVFVSASQFNSMNENSLSERAKVGADLLHSEIDDLCEEANVLNYDFVENDDGFTNAIAQKKPKKIEASYTQASKSEAIFGVFYSSDGTEIWKSENMKATIDYSKYLDAEFRGYIYDESSIYYIDAVPVLNMLKETVGVSVIGVDFADTNYVDNIKSVINAEVTVFLGDTRYSSTVVDDEGQRAVGTQMSDKVRATVLDNQEIYEGRADILGHSHFCCYEPWYDQDGNLMGAVFSGIAATESDALVTRCCIIAVICGVVVSIIAIALMAVIVTRYIAVPVNATKGLAEEMANGNLDVPDFTQKFPNNEVGDLALILENTKHRLSMYVRDMNDVMAAMADGDFTYPPQVEYAGNFAAINTAMLTIQSQIGEVVENLNVSASEVNSGAVQISNGSQLLADGTTRQAAAIEELSATINDISEKIEATAANAEDANNFAAETKNKVHDQAEDMVKMREAMADIKEKSDRVEKIVKTIEDIAFQTNILALNAAVEAARAGAAGKGFAVVADEVRNLATKSDEATKQTAAIIRETIEAIENGSTIVDETERSMAEVVVNTDKTNELIDRISEASQDQAEAIRQITDGIAQVSEVVQQNSATAEESAASSEELSGQAAILMEQVAKFKV
ncbi:MAG: cache domain-containing protein [Oscillospiraceae bacterium]|nr:cache domain-containing protein [Oscillospiraceae bacterium]